MTPISLLGRFNWVLFFNNKKDQKLLDQIVLSAPYQDLNNRYVLLIEQLQEHRDRCDSEFKQIKFLIDSTEKLIIHGNKIYQLCLPRRVKELEQKYTQLKTNDKECGLSSSRLNHLTEIEVQIKYLDETISFESRLFEQIEMNLLIFERIELTILRSESAKVSLSSLELSKASCEIQQSLDVLRDNIEGLIDLGH